MYIFKRRAVLIIICITSFAMIIAACTSVKTPETNGENQTEIQQWPNRISIAAATPGGGFFMGGSAVATVVNNFIEGVDAVVEITGASQHNVELLQAGEVEIGLVATDVLWEAYHGKFSFEGQPHDRIRTMMPGWPGVYQFITLAKYGFDDVKDFDGKSFSAGPKGSSNEAFCKYVFDLFDVEPIIMNLPSSDAARSLGDGTIHGFSLAWPAPAVTELETTHKLSIITMNDEQKKVFQEAYPQYPWLDIPPGEYETIPDGAHNAGLYNLVCVRSDLDEDFVYEIVKAVYENADTVNNTWPQMGTGMAFENVQYATAPYHPGAVRYFQEQGVQIPDELIPPEMK